MKAWVQWEWHRRIEVRGFIKIIIIERFIKGSLFILGGIVIIFLADDSNLVNLAHVIQEQINFNPAGNSGGLWHRAINWVLVRFGSLSQTTQDVIAVATMLYGGLDILEGVGLFLRRRWAEYLVLLATVAFLPLEVDELMHRVTLLKVGALLFNVVIAAYLVWRKRLFLDRPPLPAGSR